MYLDESTFIFDAIARKVWVLKGTNPLTRVNGSHKKMRVFGTITLNGERCFRQSDSQKAKDFLAYLYQLKHKLKILGSTIYDSAEEMKNQIR